MPPRSCERAVFGLMMRPAAKTPSRRGTRTSPVYDLGVLVGDGEGQAAIDAPAVEQDGAGAALPVVAALLGAGEAQPLAQRIQQCCAGIDNKRMCCPVHPQRDLKVYRKRVSSGRVRYNRLSAFTRKKNLSDRLHGLCAHPIPLQFKHQLH